VAVHTLRPERSLLNAIVARTLHNTEVAAAAAAAAAAGAWSTCSLLKAIIGRSNRKHQQQQE
jgi:hypothetical protein